MSKNLKFFLSSLLLSFPFWWWVNVFQENLEDFLFWERMASNPELLFAQVLQENELAKLKPIRDHRVPDFETRAEAAISVFAPEGGEDRVLFEKNTEKTLPIASLTKLMTAKVVLNHYDIAESEIAYLLYPLLISSDNEAASALADMVFGKDAFLDFMNLEAKTLDMENTHFFNPTGLDPEPNEAKDKVNYSTAKDLVKLSKDITANHPLIWEITSRQAFEDNLNTNELLEEFPKTIGGKTGFTILAKGCLLLVLKAPNSKGKIISVILGSPDRFRDMREQISWINSAYKW